jgi:hypothetical protein
LMLPLFSLGGNVGCASLGNGPGHTDCSSAMAATNFTETFNDGEHRNLT